MNFMKWKFLVCDELALEKRLFETFKIVEARSKDEALVIYGLHVGIKDDHFVEHVYNPIRGGLEEAFYVAAGSPPLTQDTKPQVRRAIEEQAVLFFGERTDYTEQYIAFLRSVEDEDQTIVTAKEAVKWAFSDDMLLFIWLKSYADDGFFVYRLDDMEHLKG